MEDNYIAMFVALTIWVGLFIYLKKLDSRVRKIEEEIK